jgi:hypothetical protein
MQQCSITLTSDINFPSCRVFSLLYPSSENFLLNMLYADAPVTGNVTDPLETLTNALWGTYNTTTDEATCTSLMHDYETHETQLQQARKQELSQRQALMVCTISDPLTITFCNFYLCDRN